MTNVLKPEKQEEIRALRRLGWKLAAHRGRRRGARETVGRYLRWAGIRVRPVRPPRRRLLGSAKAASEVTTDPGPASNPASQVTTDLERPPRPGSRRPESPCEPYRETITAALEQGRNAKAI